MHSPNRIRTSLRYSLYDGICYAVMFGMGDTYLNAYAIFLKATNLQIGLLSALPNLASSVFQLISSRLAGLTGRKRLMNAAVFCQMLMWAPIILIPYLLPGYAAPSLIAAVTLYTIFFGMAVPPWSSIITQYIPASKRGRYFAWRQRLTGTVTVTATFTGGLVLWLFPRESVYGFTLIFGVAMISRFLSWYYLEKMHEPKLTVRREELFPLRGFISRFKKSNFAQFMVFSGGINFATYLSAPFFAVYMLSEQKFDYLSYVVIGTMPTIAMLAALNVWGRHSDRAGCVQVMKLTSLFLPLLPILWLFSANKPYLIVCQIIGGFAWGGFNLAATNFVYDAAPEHRRMKYVAWFNLVNSAGIFLGGAAGGLMIDHLPMINGSRLLTIFLISGLLRVVIRQVFIGRIREVKPVTHTGNAELFFSVTGIRSLAGDERRN